MNNSSLSSEKDLRQDSRSDFTQGSILGKLVPFMLPILGALILQAAYGAVDLLVVGRFWNNIRSFICFNRKPGA